MHVSIALLALAGTSVLAYPANNDISDLQARVKALEAKLAVFDKAGWFGKDICIPAPALCPLVCQH